MAAESMRFPETVDEFMEQYKIVDTEQVYTNGMELVPIFRMQQWFEHLPAADVRPVVRGEWKNGGGPPYCSVCGKDAPLRSVEKNQWKLVGGRISGPEVIYSEETYLSNFCPNCGANMREGKQC